ncbi:CatA-like O-acetyltransferase [Flavobacteriaceae bacterium]|nr:CatA-like O-acetyltransferase [Flavobacteriaceae bacterium]
MRKLDISAWNRKHHFNHFNALADPYFGVTIPFDVSKAYKKSKETGVSFFAIYLHDCMKAINAVENFKYRIIDDEVFEYDVIHASATLIRADNTFGFSFVNFSENFEEFNTNFLKEKQRIDESSELYPPVNGLNCIHCSALPWFSFTSQKEPFSGIKDSVPKLAFSKTYTENDSLMMNVGISANHALIDGYHIGQFAELFQKNLSLP